MTNSQEQTPVPHRRWAVWLGMLLLIPLTAACGGMLYALYSQIVSGQLNTVAKSYGSTSRTITFADRPFSFVLLFGLQAALTGLIILVTFVMARLVVRRARLRA